ncbi:MAG: DNA polymerase III subunit delta [Pseudobdellovibrionaceae bacterium]
MKVTYRDTNGFIQQPPADIRAILVYGPDYGLMKERADLLGKTIVADLHDPFNVTTLKAEQISEDTAILSDEANAVSMLGDKRLLRIENGDDKVTAPLKAYLENPNAKTLVVIEAGNLGPRSSLRALCEKEKNAAALPCYVEEAKDLQSLIREIVSEASLRIEPQAVAWLSEAVKGDRRRARSETEKLILYKGKEATAITTEDAIAACGDAGAQTLDDFCYAVSGRNAAMILSTLTALRHDGVEDIVLLRVLQGHFRKLHSVRIDMDAGTPYVLATKKLQPPLFWKVEKTFESHIQRWSTLALMTALARLTEIESAMKKTGYRGDVMLAQFLTGLTFTKAA